MIPEIKRKLQEEIDAKGYIRIDNRLNRSTKAINGLTFSHEYSEGFLTKPVLQEKYKRDWERMYSSYRKTCELILSDLMTRQAMIFNVADYWKTNECFLSFQIIHRQNNQYDCIVHQRSGDIEKLESDIEFFEFVMHRVSVKIQRKVDKLIVFYGNIHSQIPN